MNLAGAKIKEFPEGKSARILSPVFQKLLFSVLNSWLNVKIQIPVTDGLQIVGYKTADVKISDQNAVITLPVMSSGVGASVSKYRVKEDLGACLKCVTWDGTTEGASYTYIAKPFTLQNLRTSAIKQTITYTLTYSTDTEGSGYKYWVRTISGSDGSLETQDITPPYLLNDEIRAASIPAETLDSQSCAAVDLNNDGRAWATR